MPRVFSRSEVAALEERAKELGAKGLAYVIRDEQGEVRSPIAKFLSEDELAALAPQPGETLLFAADTWAMTSRVLGTLRLHLGRELGLIDDDVFTFLWVTDFPMFEWDEEEQRWGAVHHPFTRPTDEWKDRFADEPGQRACGRLRPDRERQRARRRLVQDPRARPAGEGVRAARLCPRTSSG